jgi:hypothetical protein
MITVSGAIASSSAVVANLKPTGVCADTLCGMLVNSNKRANSKRERLERQHIAQV